MPEDEKKNGWTRPGAIDAEEARKGTAAANPVLVVASDGDPADAQTGNSRGPHPGTAVDKAAVDKAAVGKATVDKATVLEADKIVPPRDTRSPAEIEADLDRTRERLSETLDELSERLSPRDLARRGGRRVKAQFVDEQSGRLRRGRAAAVLGAVGAVIGASTALRRVRGRRQ